MKIFMDVSEVEALSVDASKALKKDLRFMNQIIESKIKAEKGDHAYKNRTGNLQKSTVSTVPTFTADVKIEMRMGMDYASYVAARGLTRFKQRKNEAKDDIRLLFEGTANAIASK